MKRILTFREFKVARRLARVGLAVDSPITYWSARFAVAVYWVGSYAAAYGVYLPAGILTIVWRRLLFTRDE